MPAMVFFDCFMEDLANGVHDLANDTLKIALTNAAPVKATADELADITQITAANGYAAGGQALDNVTSTQTAGVYSLKADDETFTADTGTMATFRYGVLYNDTATNDELIGYWDKGSAVVLEVGETFDFEFADGTVFTLTTAA